MKLILKSFFLCLICSFSTISLNAQVQKVSFSELETRITNPSNDTVYVVNFWATWCAPCVHELPEFKDAQEKLKVNNVEFIFVSLDFPGKEDKVDALFKKQELQGEVLMLSNTDANEWIEKVNKEWQGNIPVTLFSNPAKDKRYFHQGTIDEIGIKEKIITLNK